MASRPGEIDEKKLRASVGKWVAKSHAELASIFGVAGNTIKQSWVPAGMPGKSPNYDVISIFLWRIQYESELTEKQTGTTARSQSAELREIEIEDKRLDLERKRRRAAIEEGDMVERHKVEREVAALLSVTRERFLRVAAMIEPMLPADVAVEVRVEIEKQIRRQCVSMSEMAARDVLNEAHRLEKAN